LFGLVDALAQVPAARRVATAFDEALA
jgi:hypothetical protein